MSICKSCPQFALKVETDRITIFLSGHRQFILGCTHYDQFAQSFFFCFYFFATNTVPKVLGHQNLNAGIGGSIGMDPELFPLSAV